MSKNVLITGATGNIGRALIEQLIIRNTDHQLKIIAAVRKVEKTTQQFSYWKNKVDFRYFDFEKPASFSAATQGMDTLFLLRPPHLSAIGPFRSLIASLGQQRIRQIIFLSVQGAEKSSIIPHHKIEREIKASGIDYVFLRPSYFMQNLLTALRPDIQHKSEIVLPAGQAKFNWVDGEDIAEVAATLIEDAGDYQNQALEITGEDNLNFAEVAQLLSQIIGKKITYRNVHPIRFYLRKRKEGVAVGKVIVLIMLHYLPRFQRVPNLSAHYQRITGKPPTSLISFLRREKSKFLG